jgi:hypothetical protein
VPRRLTTEQKVSIEQTGELRQLIRQRDDLKRSLCGLGKDRKGTRQYKKLQELSRKVTNTGQHLRRALQTKAWKDFDHNQAVLDVEQMLSDGAADQRVPLTLVRSTGS